MTNTIDTGRILPVIVIDDAARAVELAHALGESGIHHAEVTLRTPAALQSIRAMASVAGFTVGAGTVLSVEQLAAVQDAGAEFAVSPGLDDEVLDAATARGIAFLPGVATATEVLRATRLGVTHLKFFPAHRLGGLGAITDLAAVFPEVRFVPSGGVGPDNVAEYLASAAVFAVSGSWVAPRRLIADGDFAAIRLLARAATALDPLGSS